MTIAMLVFTLVAALAAVNGANDVSKGVATLAGSGVTRYRTAILWGAGTTLAGSLLSGLFAEKMLTLFTTGIVTASPTPAFTLAVICGAAGWVALATATKLPVSTTHAIIGALTGAGILFAPASVAWAAIGSRLALPLLASIAVSFALSAFLNRLFAEKPASAPDCVCVVVEQLDATPVQIPRVSVVSDTTENCKRARSGVVRFDSEVFHWISSGAVGFARGLNDTPKLVALGVAVLGPQTGTLGLLGLVAGAMFGGSLVAGTRVAKVLAEKVVKMDHREGLMANVTTAVLVGAGANLGLPMSTTHVSTGAIAGIARGDAGRLNRRTLRDLAIAWTITPVVSGLIAAGTYLAARGLF